MADWEFNGEVDFCPPQYRKKKYEEAEQFEITDEKTAMQYISMMKYIHYLHGDDEYWVSQGHTGHNIDNFELMVEKEQGLGISLMMKNFITVKYTIPK